MTPTVSMSGVVLTLMISATLGAQSPSPSEPVMSERWEASGRVTSDVDASIARGLAEMPLELSRADDVGEQSGPWRLQAWLQGQGAPEWLRASGGFRIRYEGIDGQFRGASRLKRNDHLVFLRTNLMLGADFEDYGFYIEGMDSRQLGAGGGSAISASAVNSFELIQAFAVVRLGDESGPDHEIRVGRRAFDVGSRRLVARARFRNDTNTFDGVWYDVNWKTSALKVFWTLPIQRLPTALSSLTSNETQVDESDWDRQFVGVHFSDRLESEHRYEAYAFGLFEDDPSSRERNHVTLGGRFQLPAARDVFDYQVEGAIQFGESKLSGSGPDLDHLAGFVHLSIGYTFDCDWQPRIRLAFDYASGDDDPTDGDNGRFDTLFGARRFEYGPTGIYGAFARSNVVSPEIRFLVKPAPDVSGHISWRPFWLASDQDAWTTARVADASGASDGFLGHQFETRWRYELAPKSVRIEAGAAYLFQGDFQDTAPGARANDTAYGYLAVIFTF